MKETDFQKILSKELRMLPRCVVLNKLGTMQEGRGWPDLYVAEPRWTGWLELKVKAAVRTDQWQRIAKLREAGVDARVLRFANGMESYGTSPNKDDWSLWMGSGAWDYKKNVAEPRRAVGRLEYLRTSRKI